MATLDTTRTYNDGEVLVESDLDAFLDDIETFINVTKINDDNIQNNGITGSTKLLNQSVTEAKLATSSVTTLKIADAAVTVAKLATDSVTTIKILDENVTTAKLATDAVTAAKVADSAIETASIADDAVTAAKLADSAATDSDRAVTTDHIRDAAVTTAKINDGAVTPAKRSTNYVLSTLTGSNSVRGTTSYVQATAYASSGRPMLIAVYGGSISNTGDGGTSGTVALSRYNGSSRTSLKTMLSGSNTSVTYGTVSNSGDSIIWLIDNPAAGTYTYELSLTTAGASGNVTTSASSVQIVVYEL